MKIGWLKITQIQYFPLNQFNMTNFTRLLVDRDRLKKLEYNNGILYLNKNKIDHKKFICLHIRTSEYYLKIDKEKAEREKNVMSYRNVDPAKYFPLIQYLVNSGYYVIRMGKGYSDKLNFSHAKFIDYAVSKDRSDFLDIWLFI